jgi:hypothetical protein
MQPPIQVTGEPHLDWLICIIAWFLCLYWFRALRLAREGARLFLRSLIRAVIVFLLLATILPAMRAQTHFSSNVEQTITLFAAILAFGPPHRRKRSRYIPKATRQEVIERDLQGEEYDPQKHHIDHVWPHSRGGSNTPDNLRVIDKRKNLQKGARRPKMRDMW